MAEDKEPDKKAGISQSKNVVQGSDIKAGGNIHIGDVHHYPEKPKAEANAELEEIRKLIGKNRVESAIEGLRAAAREKGLEDDVDMLASQWESLQRQSRLGIISYDQSTTRRNQIVHGLLQIVRDLENQ